jgi:tetratricopeptide (TPR) repeat protein
MEAALSQDLARGEVKAQLARILLNPEFVRNKSASGFLKFVVEETLEGRGARLKAFTIGVEVLGRDESFDSQNNSIVRVQAARLRQLLDIYYSGDGSRDPIRIKMPLGGYRVAFERTVFDEAAPEAEDQPLPSERQSPENVPVALDGPSRKLLVAIAALSAFAAILIGCIEANHLFGSPPENESATFLTLEAVGASDPALQPLAPAFVAAVKSRIGEFEDVVLFTSETAQLRRYTLTISLHPGADGSVSYYASLINPAGASIYSDQNSIGRHNQDISSQAALMAAKIAAPYGVIYADMLVRNEPGGRKCVIDSFEYFKHNYSRRLPDVEQCLKTTMEKRPFYIPAITALSRLYLHEYRIGIKTADNVDPIQAAEALALRAAELGPQKARAFKSIFEVRFFQKRYDEAFVAAERALELNPYAADILYRVGAARIARGEFEKGKVLLDRARTLNPVVPDWAQFFFFLEAVNRADENSAAQAAEAPGTDSTAFGLIARAIVAEKQHNLEKKKKYTSALAQQFPEVAANISAALDRACLTDALRQKILAALNP